VTDATLAASALLGLVGTAAALMALAAWDAGGTAQAGWMKPFHPYGIAAGAALTSAALAVGGYLVLAAGFGALAVAAVAAGARALALARDRQERLGAAVRAADAERLADGGEL